MLSLKWQPCGVKSPANSLLNQDSWDLVNFMIAKVINKLFTHPPYSSSHLTVLGGMINFCVLLTGSSSDDTEIIKLGQVSFFMQVTQNFRQSFWGLPFPFFFGVVCAWVEPRVFKI